MKAAELLILKAFTYAVIKQKQLPEDLQQQVQAVASSLDTRVAELAAIARSSPLLATDYRWAYRYLSSSAAERGLGASVRPAPYDEDGPSPESTNIIFTPERSSEEEDKKLLNDINNRLDKAGSTDAQQALISKNPIQALIDRFRR